MQVARRLEQRRSIGASSHRDGVSSSAHNHRPARPHSRQGAESDSATTLTLLDQIADSNPGASRRAATAATVSGKRKPPKTPPPGTMHSLQQSGPGYHPSPTAPVTPGYPGGQIPVFQQSAVLPHLLNPSALLQYPMAYYPSQSMAAMPHGLHVGPSTPAGYQPPAAANLTQVGWPSPPQPSSTPVFIQPPSVPPTHHAPYPIHVATPPSIGMHASVTTPVSSAGSGVRGHLETVFVPDDPAPYENQHVIMSETVEVEPPRVASWSRSGSPLRVARGWNDTDAGHHARRGQRVKPPRVVRAFSTQAGPQTFLY